MEQLKFFILNFFATTPRRFPHIDIVRGVAFINMLIFHSLVFAKQYGFFRSLSLNTPFWELHKIIVPVTYFFLVGVSVHLACRSGIKYRNIGLRVAKLAGCAALVSATSVVLYPNSIVTFGIIHSITVCIVLSVVMIRFRLIFFAIPLGAGLVAINFYYSHEVFNSPWLNWVGLSTKVVPTFDYQPLLPWLGVVFLGLGSANTIVSLLPKTTKPLSPAANIMTTLGQHTLFLYMAHVPVILISLEILKLIG